MQNTTLMTLTVRVDPAHAESVKEQIAKIKHVELVTDFEQGESAADQPDLRSEILEAAAYLKDIRAGKLIGRPIQKVLDEL